MPAVSSLPARPTKGSPCRSSSCPGPSPTNTRRGWGLPVPNTTRLRWSHKSQRWQLRNWNWSDSRVEISARGTSGPGAGVAGAAALAGRLAAGAGRAAGVTASAGLSGGFAGAGFSGASWAGAATAGAVTVGPSVAGAGSGARETRIPARPAASSWARAVFGAMFT